MWNTDIYIGKAPNTKPEQNQGQRVVLQLTEGLKGETVCADNLFTTHDGTVELLRRGLTYLGTVRKNRNFVPPRLLEVKGKPVGHSEFVFDNINKISIVSYIAKKNRCVLLLSSAHFALDVNDKKLPTKCGVDVADQMIATYSCKRKHNRWPAVIFDYILDVSALNGFIVYSDINPNWYADQSRSRKEYLKTLGTQLITPWQLQRTSVPRAENSLRFLEKTRSESTVSLPSVPINPKPLQKCSSSQAKEKEGGKAAKRERCAYCTYDVNATKYNNFCYLCGKAVCPAHIAPVSCNFCK